MKLAADIQRLTKGQVLAAGLLLSLLLHLAFVNQPPRGVHVWRQSNTLAVARNFYEEGMQIMRPRVDRRGATDGVTGMQFPSYEYAVALGYQIVGEKNWVHRLVSFAGMGLGAWALYDLILLILGSRLASAAAAWLFIFSPDQFYFGFSALPDVLALSASLLGLSCFIRWYDGGSGGLYLLSLAGASLAGLTKLQFLAIGFPILAYVLRHPERARGWAKRGMLAIYALLAPGLSLAWYHYAMRLIESSGLRDFGLRLHGAETFKEAIRVVSHNFYSEIPELILGYPTAILFLIGLVAWIRRGHFDGPWAWPLAAWIFVLLTYYGIELGQMHDHSYYLMPLLPVLLVAAAWGALQLRDEPRLLLFLLLALPLSTSLRVLPRWIGLDKGLPAEFQDPDSLARLSAAARPGELSLVGPDDSGCVYFYYLRKKGFGFNTVEELAAKVGEAVGQGARVLYCDDPRAFEFPALKPYLKTRRLREGRFQVWELQRPK